MADSPFNEAEQYLLQHWKDARSMEEQMDKVRDKYTSICQRAVDAACKNRPELNRSKVYAWQTTAQGIGIGKRDWPSEDEGDFSGFWILEVQLDDLVDGKKQPTACVYVTGIPNREEVKKKIQADSSRIRSKDKRKNWRMEGQYAETALVYDLPESRRELLGMLMEGDGQRFVDCMARHLESLARFTDVLDKAFLKVKRKRR
jgi:hypothetical protein